MKICRDGNHCETWFGADGCVICRHGLVAMGDDSTAVSFSWCPADLMYKAEKMKWKRFMEDLPDILKKFRVLGKR